MELSYPVILLTKFILYEKIPGTSGYYTCFHIKF
jgi:hypothetical protein